MDEAARFAQRGRASDTSIDGKFGGSYLGPEEASVWEVLRKEVLNFEERAFALVAMRYQPSIGGEVNRGFTVPYCSVAEMCSALKEIAQARWG